jgi:hypothetical protein
MEIVRETIDQFRVDLVRILGSDLSEIVIHGSFALGDFAPHRGDLDYTVLTVGNLSDGVISALFGLHDAYRQSHDQLLHQLEGTFYPKTVLSDLTAPFIGCYVGTGRKGWRKISTFQNSLIDLRIMEESGIRLLRKPLHFYHPTPTEVREEQLRDLDSLREHLEKSQGTDAGFLYAAVHWCARTLYLIRQARIASKSEACRWCITAPDLGAFHKVLSAAQGKRYPYDVEEPLPEMRESCTRLLGFTERCLLDLQRAEGT